MGPHTFHEAAQRQGMRETRMVAALVWLAERVVAAPDPSPSQAAWDTFAQYGVLGVAVLLLGWFVFRILNQLWARSAQELSREVARGDRLEGENRALNLAMQDKAIPALLSASIAITQCTELIRELQRDHSRLRRTDRDGDTR